MRQTTISIRSQWMGHIGWAIVLGLLVGCNARHRSAARPLLHAVSGFVSIAGQRLPEGTITFIPELAEEAGGRPGIARIESDGSYQVGNANPDKPQGLAPGTYRVTVLAMNVRNHDAGPAQLEHRVPEIYSDWRTTPLKLRVSGPISNANFDLAVR